MYHMKTATVRDLRYDFPRIERMLAAGEPIQITKRKRVVANLVPVRSEPPKMPDFMARLKKIYGNKKLKVSWADFFEEFRD